MKILVNSSNRLDINNIPDPGFVKSGKTISGVNGYKGSLGKIIGWLLEKVFHKAVRVQAENGVFYFNCRSLVKWINRVDSEKNSPANLDKLSHQSTAVQQVIEKILGIKAKEKLQKDFTQAIKNGNFDECKKLHAQGASLKAPASSDSYLQLALIGTKGIKIDQKSTEEEFEEQVKNNNHFKIAQYLVDQGMDINERDALGESLLQTVLRHFSIASVGWLVNKGFKMPESLPELRSLYEWAKVHIPAQETQENNVIRENFIALIKSGLDEAELAAAEELKNKKQQLRDQFRQAVNSQDLDTCKELFSQGVELKRQPYEEGYLRSAIRNRHYELAQWLVDHGVDVNEVNDNEGRTDGYDATETALEMAVKNCDLQAVQWLLERGADINIPVTGKQSLYVWSDVGLSYYKGTSQESDMHKIRELINPNKITP